MMTRSLLVVVTVTSWGCGFGFVDDLLDTCSYTKTVAQTLPTAGVSRVRVIARGGTLEIHGRHDLAQLEATGTACAKSQEALDDTELVVTSSGDSVLVEVIAHEARVDLELSVSDAIRLDVQDSSGSLTISNVARVVVSDDSGSIDVTQVADDVRIQDGSGSVDVTQVAGDVRIHDGSGSVDVTQITGDVRIQDGSGGIAIADVAGSVVIVRDGSGGIAIARVEGDALVERDGSGGISAADVAGDFTVVSDGSGGITSTRVAGVVSTPQ